MTDEPSTTILKNALGRAYSDTVAGNPRSAIIGALRSILATDDIKPIVPEYLAQLEAVVGSRTIGDRCGCHISRQQLSLLRDALG